MGTRLENVQREFASYKNYVVLEKKFARVYTPPFNGKKITCAILAKSMVIFWGRYIKEVHPKTRIVFLVKSKKTYCLVIRPTLDIATGPKKQPGCISIYHISILYLLGNWGNERNTLAESISERKFRQNHSFL